MFLNQHRIDIIYTNTHLYGSRHITINPNKSMCLWYPRGSKYPTGTKCAYLLLMLARDKLRLWDIYLLMTSAQENDDGFIECPAHEFMWPYLLVACMEPGPQNLESNAGGKLEKVAVATPRQSHGSAMAITCLWHCGMAVP